MKNTEIRVVVEQYRFWHVATDVVFVHPRYVTQCVKWRWTTWWLACDFTHRYRHSRGFAPFLPFLSPHYYVVSLSSPQTVTFKPCLSYLFTRKSMNSYFHIVPTWFIICSCMTQYWFAVCGTKLNTHNTSIFD